MYERESHNLNFEVFSDSSPYLRPTLIKIKKQTERTIMAARTAAHKPVLKGFRKLFQSMSLFSGFRMNM
jgi:hypothetical protein